MVEIMKIIELNKSITESNDRDADDLRSKLKSEGVTLINLMSSPGSGKTTLLRRTVKDMDDVKIGVIEADIASDVDAVRMEESGAVAVQAHTDGMCHMDAGMTARSLGALGTDGLKLVFLENVGNLICPAEFDTGAAKNVMILSIPEGDDKPLKYPLMFEKSDVLLITKIDTAQYFTFDIETCRERALKLNPDIKVFPVSARTGEGMAYWEKWLRGEIKD